MVKVHELWLARPNNFIRLSPIAGKVEWRTNRDELGDELSFDVAEGENLPKNPCKIGDMVILRYRKELVRGIIVDENRGDGNTVSYKAFDFAFYLNKSSATYQFKKNRADECIRKVVSDFDIPIGNIPKMNVTIDEIYNQKTVSKILESILEKVNDRTGKKYYMEMRGREFHVDEPEKITSYFYLYGETFDSAYHVGNPSHKKSISDMRNIIQMYNKDDELVYEAKNNNMIDKYGILQETVKLDEDEKQSAKTIAKNKLNELAQVSEESSVELMGNDNVRSNRILNMQEPHTGIVGDFLVTSTTHKIENSYYTMSLDLEAME